MVIQLGKHLSRRGVLEVDMLIALALLFGAAIPLMCSFSTDARALRFGYERAVAMECVDGEMEVLAAGGWRNHPLGTNEIILSGNAARNLHPPTATLIRLPDSIRLEWHPNGRRAVRIMREVKLPMKLPLQYHASSERGISLIQCLAYIGVLGLLIAIGGSTVAKAWDQSRGLAHNTSDIQKALSLGEHWRSDIRAATGRIVSTHSESNQTVVIPTSTGEVAYEFRAGELCRRTDKSAPWVRLYETVTTSQMESFTRDNVTAWRWEVELKSTYKKVRIRPQFTFIAVPGKEVLP